MKTAQAKVKPAAKPASKVEEESRGTPGPEEILIPKFLYA